MFDGSLVGEAVGSFDGSLVGEAVGSFDGSLVGETVGLFDGSLVGETVGSFVVDFRDISQNANEYPGPPSLIPHGP